MSDRPRVAVVGLGSMGLPMATRLAATLPVTGSDPAPPRRDLADRAGIGTAATPGAAARDADVVLLAVRDQAQVDAALFGPDGVTATLRPGATVILTSTVGPDAARTTAARLGGGGHLLVDAPVSGGPARAGAGDLLVVVGAGGPALEAARPVLDLLLGRGAAGSFMFADRGPRMVQAYTGGAEVRSRVDIFVKDLGIVSGAGRDAHVPLPLAAAAQQLFLLAEAAGLGAADDSSVVTLLSPPGSARGEQVGEG
ncbi:MAG: NAD(P)-dependent oxidoreductase [Pseudonocardiales bacterium]|nr:NAD(P)-dependent oxidoreductase [Pseudonocardiales bacterium]